MKISENERMLLEVARKLPADLLPRVVFLGGAVVGCLLTDEGVGEVRGTQDVDLIVGISTRGEFQWLEEKLRNGGFSPSMEEGAPICRWRIGNLNVDIMPSNAEILGFSNKWYEAAMKNSTMVILEHVTFRIVSAPYFLATKIEAFLGRGQNDFLGSPDMEDIVTLIDGRKELIDEIREAPQDLQDYFGDIFHKWLQEKVFLSCLSGHSTAGPVHKERVETIKKKLEFIVQFGRRG